MKKVLIVEDEQAYIRLLRDKLASRYQIIDARNGKKGLSLALKEKPDLILLDIRMPVMDGLSALKELRKDKYGKTARVILLTNLEANDKIIGQVTKDLPAYYFVKSDVGLEDILKKIDELLGDEATE